MTPQIFALALLCAQGTAPADCHKSNAVRWWRGDPCMIPATCLMLASERAAKTEVEPRNGEHWKFSATRDEMPMEGGR